MPVSEEIQLPTHSSNCSITEEITNRKKAILHRDHSAKAASSLVQVPIIYHYLTFETSLPSSYPWRSLSPDYIDAPDPPDLLKYASPFTWSESRKRIITWLSCTVTVTCAYSAGAYSPASNQLSEYWGVSQLATYVGITTFTTGFAIAPMVLAPFSEINGRYPVFVTTGTLFVACQIFCAICRSFPGMLVARFFLGVGGSTFSTMVGGVVSDMYHTADRNQPMTLFAGRCSNFEHLSMNMLTRSLRRFALRFWLGPSMLRLYCSKFILALGVLRSVDHIRHFDSPRHFIFQGNSRKCVAQ